MANNDIIIDDILAGLNAVISVNVIDPSFTSQAKTKLSGAEVEEAIYKSLVREFNKFISTMDNNDKETLTKKIINNSKIRKAADVAKATKRKSLINKSPANLPSKLKECDKVGDELSELYICLAGDTKVRLSDGSSEKIKDLVGKENVKVSSYNGSEPIVTNMKRAFKTQEVKKTLKFTFEDGSTIECTPEHKFLVNNEWVMAKNLKPEDSIDTI